MGILTESRIEGAPVSLDRGSGVYIARCPDHFRDLGQRHFFDQVVIVGIIEMIHTRLPLPDPQQSLETGLNLSHQGQVGGRFTGHLSALLRPPPVKLRAVVTGHYIVAAAARFRLIVKVSHKPRDVRDRLLSLTITPTVYSTCDVMSTLKD